MLEAFGGAAMPRVIPAERPAAAADLVEAQLAAGELAAANETLGYGEAAAAAAGTAWAAATIARARAAVLLAEGRPTKPRRRPTRRAADETAAERPTRGVGDGEAAAGAPLASPSSGSPRVGRSRRPATAPRRSRC